MLNIINGSRNSSAATHMNNRAKGFCGVPESVGFNTCVRCIALLLLVAGLSLAQDVPAAPSFSITGVVKSGNTPIPGATVTATNASTQEKTTTSTDVNGAYTLQVAGGKYELRVEMPAFAAEHARNYSGRPQHSCRRGIDTTFADATSGTCPAAAVNGWSRPRISKSGGDARAGRRHRQR